MSTRRQAMQEIATKSAAAIERASALKWADYALAARALHRRTKEAQYARRAEDYRHEALEHAALAEDGGKTLRRIERLLARKES